MTLGLTTEGFSRDRLAEIKTEYDGLVTDALGPVNTNADSVIGQMEGVWAEGISNIQETLQDTYDAMYPYSAEGTSLDGAVSFIGLTRIPSSATVVTAACYGDEGVVVPAGVICHADVTYTSTSAVTISRANALDLEIEVNTVSNSTSYNIYAGGVSSTYTSGAAATKTEIIAGLAAAVASDDLLAVANSETLRITASNGVSPFAITVDAKLTITKRGSPVVFVCDTKGATVCPVGALVNIDTPIDGLDEVYNLAAGATGRDAETDTELRLRQQAGVRATGSATVKAIKARILQEVDSVTACQIYENRRNYTVDSLPSHSFETVVSGGDDGDVFMKIWELKPAGIETYGNTTGTVIDENGDAQTIKFSRPVNQYAWVKVTVNLLYSEEPLTTSVIGAIKDAVLAYGNTLTVGEDIITQRFYGGIYSATSGIGQITVEADVTDAIDGTPSYSTDNVAIARAGIAVFDTTRISVLGV